MLLKKTPLSFSIRRVTTVTLPTLENDWEIPGGSPFFQWTEVSFDLSIMARFLWRLVFNLLNLTFSNPENPIFTEIGGGDNC